MTDSPFLNEYILKGEQKGKLEELQQSVTRALQKRFKTQVTDEVLTYVGKESSRTILEKWFDLALEADSWVSFRTQFNRHLRSKAKLAQGAAS